MKKLKISYCTPGSYRNQPKAELARTGLGSAAPTADGGPTTQGQKITLLSLSLSLFVLFYQSLTLFLALNSSTLNVLQTCSLGSNLHKGMGKRGTGKMKRREIEDSGCSRENGRMGYEKKKNYEKNKKSNVNSK